MTDQTPKTQQWQTREDVRALLAALAAETQAKEQVTTAFNGLQRQWSELLNRLEAETQRRQEAERSLEHWKNCHGVTADALAASEQAREALRTALERISERTAEFRDGDEAALDVKDIAETLIAEAVTLNGKQARDVRDGEWIVPDPQQGFLWGCCDCGLTHSVDFRVEDGLVEFRVYRDETATAELRAKRHAREDITDLLAPLVARWREREAGTDR